MLRADPGEIQRIFIKGKSSLTKKNSVLKQNAGFIPQGARPTPNHLLYEFGEAPADLMGPNVTDHAAIQPSHFKTFPIEVETWVAHTFLFEPGNPYWKISSYIGDENRPMQVAYSNLDYAFPDGGIQTAQIILSPKPGYTNPPAVAYAVKNLLVLKNPVDIGLFI